MIESLEGRPLDNDHETISPARGPRRPSNDRWVARSSAGSPTELDDRTASAPRQAVVDWDSLQRAPDDEPWEADEDAGFDMQFAQLQLRLSQEVARDPARWSVAALRRAAERLVESGESALQRGKARRLLEEVRSLEHLQRRYERMRRGDAVARADSVTQAANSREETGGVIQRAAGNVRSSDAESALPEQERQVFDRQGWLLPVESRSGAAPPYALVDEDGALLCLITPSPGLNIRPFVKQHVGVYGATTLLPELKTTHITAREVLEIRR